MKRTGFSERTRKIIMKRDFHRCLVCGIRKQDMQIHHRCPRRMGGTLDPWVNSPANGVLLCAGCHQGIELDRTLGYAQGLLLHAGQRPPLVSVASWRGRLWLLEDGTSRLVAEVMDGAIDATSPPYGREV